MSTKVCAKYVRELLHLTLMMVDQVSLQSVKLGKRLPHKLDTHNQLKKVAGDKCICSVKKT